MTKNNIIEHYIKRYKETYVYGLPHLMETITFENKDEERQFEIVMLKHNREMIELELQRKKELKKLGKKAISSQSQNDANNSSQEESSSNDNEPIDNTRIDISKEWQIVAACDTKEQLTMTLEELKKGMISPKVIREILLEFRKRLKDAEDEKRKATDEDWKKECENEIRIIQWKISTIISFFNDNNKSTDEEEPSPSITGHLIYLCSDSGNPFVLGDFDRDISREYYSSFSDLLGFIRNGEALTCNDPRKCIKLENRGYVYNMYEAKSYQSRVIFSLIAKDTYVVIAAFIKKDYLAFRTSNIINERSKSYNWNKEWLLLKLHDQTFLEEQEKIEQGIQSLLGGDNLDKSRSN